MRSLALAYSLVHCASFATAAVIATPASISSPTVKLDYATFKGFNNDSLSVYLGIPYAQPPVGPLRFNQPQAPEHLSGIQNATHYGNSCTQQVYNLTAIGIDFPIPVAPGTVINPQSEDCLYINIITPANVTKNSKLPVLFYIYGGGWEIGDTGLYDGQPLVRRSIALDEPVIFVSANYRLNAFGFLPGKEVKEAGIGNLGLEDQRFALAWAQEHISAFGGDPERVTVMGESAGSTSISLQMVLNGGNLEGLFHGAILQSGFIWPLPKMEDGQDLYDALLNATSCTSLDCLRSAPYDVITSEMRKLPSLFSLHSLSVSWGPRLDRRLFVQDPKESVKDGKFAKIPVISGDYDDEGTVFSLVQRNLTTGAEDLAYLHSNYFPTASDAQVQRLGELYTDDPATGAPFGTGSANQLYPEYKRIAAIQGDLIFEAPRRFFNNATVARGAPVWSYKYNRGKNVLPLVGVFHGSDTNAFFGFPTNGTAPDFVATDAVISFVNRLDPNRPGSNQTQWPQYAEGRELYEFLDEGKVDVVKDDYRKEGMEFLDSLPLFDFP